MRVLCYGLLLAPLTALVVLAGCGTTDTSPSDAAPVPADPAVKLKEVTVEQLDQAVRDQKGKVVLMDIWFLGCDPCVKKFPHTVQLHNEYADEGLVCMSVDIEENELKKQDKVLDFLRKKKAAFANYIVRDTEANADAWRARVGWQLTPTIIFFDRSGAKARVMEGPTDGEVENEVKRLLAKK